MKKILFTALMTVILLAGLSFTVSAQEEFKPYIPEKEMPDVVQCIPAPPEDPSTGFDYDILRYMWGKQQRKDSVRLAMAVRDAVWNMDTTLAIL